MGTFGSSRDRLTVVYCLFEGCRQTRWLNLHRWDISIEREEGMESGRFDSMAGLFCPDHNIGEPVGSERKVTSTH